MNFEDNVTRFLFDNHAVRGEITQLHETLEAFLRDRPYPLSIRKLMMELSCAAVLVASTLKDGSEIMLQIKGGDSGSLKYALVNIRQDLSFYGSAVLKDGCTAGVHDTLADLFGTNGIMTMSVFPADGPKWQGVVPLNPASLGAALEDYFRESQQLPTRFFIWSEAEEYLCGGLILQIIPNEANNLNSLEHLSVLTATLTAEELFGLAREEILHRLFAKEDLRLFAPQRISFRCICSKERCLNALAGLRAGELESLVSEGGTEMTCQHCGRTFNFTKDELQALLMKNSQ